MLGDEAFNGCMGWDPKKWGDELLVRGDYHTPLHTVGRVVCTKCTHVSEDFGSSKKSENVVGMIVFCPLVILQGGKLTGKRSTICDLNDFGHFLDSHIHISNIAHFSGLLR